MLISKPRVTIIAYDSSDAHTYRNCLETCNYHVDVIWIGSYEELMAVFNDANATSDTIIIDTHGDSDKGFVSDSNPTFTFADIANTKGLFGKRVVSTACDSGTDRFVESFNKAGTSAYVAPKKEVGGPETIIFLTTFFYNLNKTTFYPDVEPSDWSKVSQMKEVWGEDWVFSGC